jgi:CheY-like chemotaxis protein
MLKWRYDCLITQLINIASEDSMNRQAEFLQAVHQLTAYTTFCCPVQVLVIDRPNGPADVLINTISLLLEREVSVTIVRDDAGALRAMEHSDFNLVVIGLERSQPAQLTLLPHIRRQRPDTPVMLVADHLTAHQERFARQCGADHILTLPERASELRTLAMRLAAGYLRQSA